MSSEISKQVPTGPWYYLEDGRVQGPLNSSEVKTKFDQANLPAHLTLFSDRALKKNPTKAIEIVHSLEPAIHFSAPNAPAGQITKEEPSLTPSNVDSENEAVTQLIQVFHTAKSGRTGYTTNQADPVSTGTPEKGSGQIFSFSLQKWISMIVVFGLFALTAYGIFNVFRILNGGTKEDAPQTQPQAAPSQIQSKPSAKLPAAKPFRTAPTAPTPPPALPAAESFPTPPPSIDRDPPPAQDFPPPFPAPDDPIPTPSDADVDPNIAPPPPESTAPYTDSEIGPGPSDDGTLFDDTDAGNQNDAVPAIPVQ